MVSALVALRIVATRSSVLSLGGAVAAIVALLLALDAPRWWGSSTLLGQSLVRDTSGFVVSVVGGVAAFTARGQGRRQPDAVDDRGVRDPDLPFLARVALAAAAAAGAVLLVSGLCIALTAGSLAFGVPAAAIVVACCSVSTAAVVGLATGWVWRSIAAVPTAAVVVFVLARISIAEGSTRWTFGLPNIRVAPYYEVRVHVFLASCVVVGCAISLAVSAIFYWRRRSARRVTLTAPYSFLRLILALGSLAGAVWLGASGPQPVLSIRTDGVQCIGGSPKICVYAENFAAAERSQAVILRTHEVLGTWPVNRNPLSPSFYELGLETENDPARGQVIVAASPLVFEGNRLDPDGVTALYSNIAGNWSQGTDACGRPREVDPELVLALMQAEDASRQDRETWQRKLGLVTTCR